ncbi:hypothetical protein V6N12_051066 [Hibiscus sabdariffa]|uniref:Uncharacterized protein n=1 Tax=Hibiscus sabdariffa TaxID=183260 RepID=A0ABR2GEJ1_9ROSI
MKWLHLMYHGALAAFSTLYVLGEEWGIWQSYEARVRLILSLIFENVGLLDLPLKGKSCGFASSIVWMGEAKSSFMGPLGLIDSNDAEVYGDVGHGASFQVGGWLLLCGQIRPICCCLLGVIFGKPTSEAVELLSRD